MIAAPALPTGLAPRTLEYLASVMHAIAGVCSGGGTAALLSAAITDALHAHYYTLPPNSGLRHIALTGCQAVVHLSPQTLARAITANGIPPARFVVAPPPTFDSALVPAENVADGSGYILYLRADLPAADVYAAIAHSVAHLAYGHVRKGDLYGHWERIAEIDMSHNRWSKRIAAQRTAWLPPLPFGAPPVTWDVDGFTEAYLRVERGEVDPPTFSAWMAAPRYQGRLLTPTPDAFDMTSLFPHQLHGAADLAMRLQRYGVALLADSVGLGKTRTTAALIALLRSQNVIKRAAILTPDKLMENWRAEIAQVGLSVADDTKQPSDVLLVNKDKFKRNKPETAHEAVTGCDLLVIEEAHQDMRNTGNKFHQNVRAVATGRYGLLVTATPWNNKRGDVYAMLQPFAAAGRGTDRSPDLFAPFTGTNIEGYKSYESDTSQFRRIYNAFTLQRTRRQLRESGDGSVYYAPRHPYLVELQYTEQHRHAFAGLLERINDLRMPASNPLRYLMSDDSGEEKLSGLNKFVLLKCAESSMNAFKLALESVEDKTKRLRDELHKVPHDEKAIEAWLLNRYNTRTTETEAEPDSIPLRFNRAYATRVDNIAKQARADKRLRNLRQTLLDDCDHDITLLRQIETDFSALFRNDPKIEAIVTEINRALEQGHKVLCISRFTATALAVYKRLQSISHFRMRGIGLVIGSTKDGTPRHQINGEAVPRESVMRRFAPISWKGVDPRAEDIHLRREISILVGSDTLSVGQNLQDAHVLINLDLCWNPMQHEQRIGRIDRPRHHSDNTPLDIVYFLNTGIIESELQLHTKLAQRLEGVYHDTSFDDEIMPGYFEMIERFRAMRAESASALVSDADDVLSDIADRSARPDQPVQLDNEVERAALYTLQQQAAAHPVSSNMPDVAVTLGRIPFAPTMPHAAIALEVCFQPVDKAGALIGDAVYHPFYRALPDNAALKDTHLNFLEALVAEKISPPLSPTQLEAVATLLTDIEPTIAQAQADELKRLQRIRRVNPAEVPDLHGVSARLINLRLLV